MERGWGKRYKTALLKNLGGRGSGPEAELVSNLFENLVAIDTFR